MFTCHQSIPPLLDSGLGGGDLQKILHQINTDGLAESVYPRFLTIRKCLNIKTSSLHGLDFIQSSKPIFHQHSARATPINFSLDFTAPNLSCIQNTLTLTLRRTATITKN